MSTGDLLSAHPSELKFPFELWKQCSCSVQLTNKTDKHVAFKVKTTSPKRYCVKPNVGIILPGSTCNVTVTMQAPKEMPADMQCKDKFLLQSVLAPDGVTAKGVTSEMFNKADGKVVGAFKLRVVYIPANPPSPVPEESEEGSPPHHSVRENEKQNSSLFDDVFRSLEASTKKSSEAWSVISKLTEEKACALQQNQKLRQDLELARKEVSKRGVDGFSLVFMALVSVLGVLIGFYMKKT
ncbi:hypothetical protein UlMin_021173 [Ulmus minor]